MRFGLRKLTLLDYPEKVACTVFTCGCNFRCPFCHNPALVTGSEAALECSFADVLAFLETRRGQLDAVCITGGEPLLHEESGWLAEAAKGLGYLVKLDTNGSFPDRLKDVLDRGLVDAVAMDVKNVYAKYDETAGVTGMAPLVAESEIRLKEAGLAYYELRTTVVRQFHTADDLAGLAREHAGTEHYFLQKFTDSGDLLGAGLSAMSDEEMAQALEGVRKFIPNAQLRGVESPDTIS